MPRAQDEVDEQDGAHGQRQRGPIGDDVARGRRAHVEQRLHPLDARDFVGDEGRQRRAGAAAQLLELREHQAVDLGHHPGADGEVGAAQPEDDKGGGERQRASQEPGEQDGNERIEPGVEGEREQQIAAEADEGLLAHRDEPGIAGEQVPILRQRQHGEHEDQVVEQVAAGEGGERDEQGNEADAGNADVTRKGCGDLDAVAASRRRLLAPHPRRQLPNGLSQRSKRTLTHPGRGSRKPVVEGPARSVAPNPGLHPDRSHDAGSLQQTGIEKPLRLPPPLAECKARQLHHVGSPAAEMGHGLPRDQLLAPARELSAQVHGSPHCPARGKSPRGRSTSTARNARCPAKICHSGSILAPTAWATPMMMPPKSVPHRLPSPPMMTASKA